MAIEEFFRAQANFSRTFPIYLGNMDPALISGLAVVGRVIGEPEFVHDALRRTKLLVSDIQFYPDGIRSWMAQVDAPPEGGLSFDPGFICEFEDGLRAHQVRLAGGDASSDSFCYS